MKNLISSETYKLFKSKSLWICTIVGCAMALFVVMTYLMLSIAMKAEIPVETEDENGSITTTTTTMADEMNAEFEEMGMSEADMAMLTGSYDGELMLELGFYGTSLQLLVAVFVAIFVAGEFSNGTIKMIVSRGYNRSKVYFAKLISSNIASAIMASVIVAFATVAGTIIWGWHNPEKGSAASASDILVFIVIQLLLNVAITTMFVAIAMMFKNLGASIAITIASYSFGSIVFMLADAVIKGIAKAVDISVSKIPIMPSELWIVQSITNMSKYDFSSKDIGIALGVFAGYTIIFTAIGQLMFNKKDIK